ncbi:hypothetical protein ABMA27_002789 [Loxostege sticticalis]|uniref:Uncharacterized protein n=1 Tax=Loxostege sticticalis TaxID=481309 RepID=A0ABR3HUX0_LOXSC
MNVQRSPTGCGSSVRLSGSQPNLSEMNPNLETLSNITHRNKRKEPDDDAWIRDEFSDIKKQISELMAALQFSTSSQAKNISKLSEDITTIKNHVNNIGSTIENIILDQNNIKTKLNNLDTTTVNIEKKIKLLESDINKFNEGSPLQPALQISTNYEDIVNEVNERNVRSKNIVIVGIPEPDVATDRHTYNKNEVLKITKTIYADCPEPLKIILCFSSEEPVKAILRNKSSAKFDPIKIFSDQTPYQRMHMQNLKEELVRRTANGETNLKIKYIKGTPKIITATEEKQGERRLITKN